MKPSEFREEDADHLLPSGDPVWSGAREVSDATRSLLEAEERKSPEEKRGDLIALITNVPLNERSNFGKQLLALDPTDDDLSRVAGKLTMMHSEVATLLLTRSPQDPVKYKSALLEIARDSQSNELLARILRRLEEVGVSDSDIFGIEEVIIAHSNLVPHRKSAFNQLRTAEEASVAVREMIEALGS